jgi:hypothetical protein
MKLKDLVDRADNTYGLALSESDKTIVRRRLRMAGYYDEIIGEQVSDAIDLIINPPVSKMTGAVKIAGGPKLTTAASAQLCPRCQRQMGSTNLATGHVANYCPACKITIP